MPKDERESSSCVWDITVPADRHDVSSLRRHFSLHCKKFTFQLEQGANSGYRHYQCRVSLKTKSRKATLLNSAVKLDGWHISPTSGANKDNDFYVTKDDTRVDGPWTDQDKQPLKTVDKMTVLYPWQQRLLDETDAFDDRTIHILVDPNGNIGKSAFTKYLWYHRNACIVPPLNQSKDLMQFVCSFEPSKLYIIDMPRAMKKKHLYELYSGIEQLKNGMMYDTRYHGKFKYVDEPNIIVFTNTIPKLSYLSRDRWNLWEIIDQQLVAIHDIKDYISRTQK